MKKTMLHTFALFSLLACAVPAAHATLQLNELFVGPEDGANPEGFGREFFEINSTTGGAESLSGIWLLEINGTGLDSGRVDQAIDLGAAPTPSTGANGLFLRRDNSDVLVPNPAPSTVIQVGPFSGEAGLQADDNATYALVSNFSGALGQDLDADDDGTLDTTPWSAVSDALGIVEAGTPGFSYSAQLGGQSLLDIPFGPDAVVRLPSGLWFAFDAPNGEDDPTYFGPFTASDGEDNIVEDGTVVPPVYAEQFQLTPGSSNPAIVPEPTSLVLLAWGAALVAVRRRAKS